MPVRHARNPAMCCVALLTCPKLAAYPRAVGRMPAQAGGSSHSSSMAACSSRLSASQGAACVIAPRVACVRGISSRAMPRELRSSRASLRIVNAVAEPAAATATVEKSKLSNLDRVTVLSEALPLLQKFRGKTIVVKYGGAAMKDPTLKAGVITDIVLLATVGIRVILVHGGGPEINSWLEKVGIKPEFKNGLRVTDGATMEIVEMVLGGRVNKSLVSLIQQAGGQALGLTGKDGGLLRARQMVEKDIGFVGEVTKVEPKLLQIAVQDGIIPVVATIATDDKGQALNINADTAAGEIAAALQAEKLVLMTDVPGVLHNKDDPSSLYSSLDIRKARTLIEEGIIAGGMIPKIDCCIRCLAQGVKAAHIIDGRARHGILMELLTDDGIGTMITG